MSVLFWPSLFLVLGLLLLIVEVFIPSGGLIGICSIACLLLCLWYAFSQSPLMGAAFMLVDLVALPLTAMGAFSLWSRSRLGRKFFLQPPARDEIDVSHTDHHLGHLVDQVGRALTPLRPCGRIEIDGRRVDGLAEEGFVPAGSLVRVLRVRSGQLIVRGLADVADLPRGGHSNIADPAGPDPGHSPISPTALAVSIFEDAP